MPEVCPPHKVLLDAKRALYTLSHVKALGDWGWEDSLEKWVLCCRLHIDSANPSLIPDDTAWYVLVDNIYPLGRIKFYPAKRESITKTFHHQMYNASRDDNISWRTGDICIQTTTHIFGLRGYDAEPYDHHQRLKWHFQRAIQWLEKASKGTLIKNGDYFELPDYNTQAKPITIVLWESSETFNIWKNQLGNSGAIDLGLLRNHSQTYIPLSFKNYQSKDILKPTWNRYIIDSVAKTEFGIWVLFPEIIAMEPWQAPMNWGELVQIAKQQNINIHDLIRRVSKQLRDGKLHIALLGFPVPDKVGAQPTQIHWQASLLPILSHGTVTANGFRTNELGYYMGDRRILSGKQNIDWQKGENWHPEQISTRGHFNNELNVSRILIIGAGAIGSLICDLLARGGAKDIILVDNDELEIGNLVRHTLLMDDVGMSKSEQLEKQLLKINPNLQVKGINLKFQEINKSQKEIIQGCKIVFNCTANDEVLYFCEEFPWKDERVFCSVSVGYKAKRVYVFISRSMVFARSHFQTMIQDWLQKDMEEFGNVQLPRTGTGCWHPAFPARVDDMWLAASVALKYFEKNLDINSNSAKFAVFQQSDDKGHYGGIELVSEKQETF